MSEGIEERAVGPQAKSAKKRQVSKIRFPYYDLGAAAKIVGAIHGRGGGRCTLDQLVGFLPNFSTVDSGAFRLLVSATRTFGLIEVGGKEVVLTEAGYAVVSSNEEEQRRARAESFLAVPLFRSVYEQCRGRTLPPKVGMQRIIEQLGVVPNQSGLAYDVLMRSAEQAGFFEGGGKEYLIEPTAMRRPTTEKPPISVSGTAASGDGGGTSSSSGSSSPPPSGIHPAIMGLLQLLPPQGQPFPQQSRQTWLQSLGGTIDLIYGMAKEDERGE
jgi:hypothetical protein